MPHENLAPQMPSEQNDAHDATRERVLSEQRKALAKKQTLLKRVDDLRQKKSSNLIKEQAPSRDVVNDLRTSIKKGRDERVASGRMTAEDQRHALEKIESLDKPSKKTSKWSNTEELLSKFDAEDAEDPLADFTKKAIAERDQSDIDHNLEAFVSETNQSLKEQERARHEAQSVDENLAEFVRESPHQEAPAELGKVIIDQDYWDEVEKKEGWRNIKQLEDKLEQVSPGITELALHDIGPARKEIKRRSENGPKVFGLSLAEAAKAWRDELDASRERRDSKSLHDENRGRDIFHGKEISKSAPHFDQFENEESRRMTRATQEASAKYKKPDSLVFADEFNVDEEDRIAQTPIERAFFSEEGYKRGYAEQVRDNAEIRQSAFETERAKRAEQKKKPSIWKRLTSWFSSEE